MPPATGAAPAAILAAADALIGACVESHSMKWGNNATNFAASFIAAVTAVVLAALLS